MNVPAKGAKRRLAFVLFFVFWLLKFIFGLIAARRAPSYPDADAVRVFPYPYMGDMGFYVVTPAAFAVFNLLMAVFASKIPRWLAIIAAILQILLLLVLLFLGTGGV